MNVKELIEFAGEDVLQDEMDDLYAEISELRKSISRKEDLNQRLLSKLELLQEYQVLLPEPHRTVICNVIANGSYSASKVENEAIADALDAARGRRY